MPPGTAGPEEASKRKKPSRTGRASGVVALSLSSAQTSSQRPRKGARTRRQCHQRAHEGPMPRAPAAVNLAPRSHDTGEPTYGRTSLSNGKKSSLIQCAGCRPPRSSPQPPAHEARHSICSSVARFIVSLLPTDPHNQRREPQEPVAGAASEVAYDIGSWHERASSALPASQSVHRDPAGPISTQIAMAIVTHSCRRLSQGQHRRHGPVAT